MSLGQNIRNLRIKNEMTQKQLSERLYVTAQAVSRWENDEVEPSISVIKSMAEIFGVDINTMINGMEDEQEPGPEPEPREPERIPITRCHDCDCAIYEGDRYYKETISSHTGTGPMRRTVNEVVTICQDCKEKRDETEKRKIKRKADAEKASAHARAKYAYIWGIVAGIGTAISFLIYAVNTGETWSYIMSPIMLYGGFAFTYCVIQDTYIQNVFLGILQFGFVRFPGLIVSFSPDGCAWYIAMKILFIVLGAALAIIALSFAFCISTFLAIFSFPFYAKKGL